VAATPTAKAVSPSASNAVAKDAIVAGKITGMSVYGVFVRIDRDNRGLLHVSEMAGNSYAEREARLRSLKFNDTIEALVIKVTEPEAGSKKERRVSLSERALACHRSQEKVTRTSGATMTLSVIRPTRDCLLLRNADGTEVVLPDENLKGTAKASILKSRRVKVRLVGVDARGRVIAEKA